MVTWDLKVIISRAAVHLVEWEFDMLVPGMSKRVWTQKAPRIIEIKSFKGLEGVTKVAHPNYRALLIGLVYTWWLI